MAAANLLALLDDIATVLDDVSVMTKAAAKKTAGLMGDDLAVNADQVTGFSPNRELPVIWGVAKGATVNKVILIPLALLLSTYAKWLLTPLLLIGGTYLAYEGVHKIYHTFFHGDEKKKEEDELRKAFRNGDVDMKEYEQKKIWGAIRTDFILSAEIIVISLKAITERMPDATLTVQLGTLTAIGLLAVVLIYGLVAGIVKIDDIGLKLREKGGFLETIGDGFVHGSPKIMKGLGIIGTIAMLLVGGGLYNHNIEAIHKVVKTVAHSAGVFEPVVPTLLNGVIGLAVGAIALPVVHVFSSVTGSGDGEDGRGH
jgi:predicted DNA repair protein MutK